MTLRQAAQAALEACADVVNGWESLAPLAVRRAASESLENLRAALAEPVQTQQENTMPITDDNGKPLRPQYQVIEQIGNWRLLYDQLQLGEAVRHEFRIQKLRHDIALYPGITMVEAQKRFRERVETDNE